MTTSFHHPLDVAPEGAVARSVAAAPVTVDLRPALRISLTDEVTRNGVPGVHYIDQPTFLVVPVEFTNGTIAVDVRSRLDPAAPGYARAFAGIAYRISPAFDRFEAVYLRPLNGLKVNPPQPRNRRAVQHFSYPEWPFERLRASHPDGTFEAGADIGPDEWTRLQVQIEGRSCTVSVNDDIVLTVAESTAMPSTGLVGLFVDIGTEAFFANLSVRSAPPSS